MTKRPIENCYWVVEGKFLAGEYPRNIDKKPSRMKTAALEESGVTVFIDLTQENEGLPPYVNLLNKASHHRFPIQDLSIPDSPAAMKAILDAIDRCISNNELVYVHCWGGIGRTGTVVGCWLSRHGYKGQVALDRLRELWKACPKSEYCRSPETDLQEQYILLWEEE